jgi:hypothetical protein
MILGVEILTPCQIAVLDNLAKKEEKPVREFIRSSAPRSLVVA